MKFTYITIVVMISLTPFVIKGQVDTITIGFGEYSSVSISSSDADTLADNTLDESGFLPNESASSRFLSQATIGYNIDDINEVAVTGIEDWIDMQFLAPREFVLTDKVMEYVNYHIDSLGSANYFSRQWRFAWWQYFMTSEDLLRQRVALALSEILVISEESSFSDRSLALAGYYDILLDNAFGNYRDLLEDVTYHPAMGQYLTYINNKKSDPANNKFPDENYARELMQLFSIGLHELNVDGSPVLDENGDVIPTYDGEVIAEFAKVFTGLSWPDRTIFGKSQQNDSSYVGTLNMFNDYHEPGSKYLLNDFEIIDRIPVDGNADIQDALDNVFNHQNVAPFISRLLIQRLVTSNPPPEYIARVASVFNNNGEGVRGDLKAVIKAILLDSYANSCSWSDDPYYGMLREPFIRYTQMHKALNVSSSSGNYRNEMSKVFEYTGQRPLSAISVFNFFQSGFQPLGPINDAGLVAPEFQITDTRSVAGYINAVYSWIMNEDISDENRLFSGEVTSGYYDEYSTLDFSDDILLADNDALPILLDKYNLVFAQGRITQSSPNYMLTTLKKFPNEDDEDKEDRVKLALYFILTSPEYLINR